MTGMTVIIIWPDACLDVCMGWRLGRAGRGSQAIDGMAYALNRILEVSSVYCCRHFFFMPALYSRPEQLSREGAPMDDYQEELLEYRASEHDPLEPADDATEL